MSAIKRLTASKEAVELIEALSNTCNRYAFSEVEASDIVVAEDAVLSHIAALEGKLTRAEKDAERWKHWACHLDTCRPCGEGYYCDDGIDLKDAALLQPAVERGTDADP